MRILSAIRHEVLKHNTMALAGVGQALRNGEPAGDKAAHLDRALFGEAAGGDGGARARLHGYADQLRQLGRAHGLRVNLARRDPALGPLLEGFARLARVRGALRAVEQLGPRARQRLLATLERAGLALHERGYAGLRDTLDRIRFFRVDAGGLRAVFERTRGEPAFAQAEVAELALAPDAALPCTVGMPAHAFEEVMTNLMRNALAATLEGGGGAGRPVQVGVSVRAEVDAITGLEQVAFAVCDRAPGALPEGALRKRYIEAGLGLTADLVARYEGSLDVQPEPGWSKAVVLRLPCGLFGEEAAR
jgi:signal transduction histidine kinase